MPSRIEVEGKVFRVGDRLRSELVSGDIAMCNPGTEVTIVCILTSKSDGTQIGVRSEIELSGWHDLDGRVPHGYGLWVRPSTLMKCFKELSNSFVVGGEFYHRKKNLKGMRLRLLNRVDKSLAMVELEENVGGGGGDGLGKAGHCVLLPSGLIAKEPTKKKSK